MGQPEQNPKGHVHIITTRSEKQVGNFRENDKDVEESSDEKKVKIDGSPLTPPEKDIVKKVEKEAPYVSPHPYKPPIPFLQRFMEAKVETQSKRYAEIVEKILIDVPLTKVLSKNRILKDHESGKLLMLREEG